MGAIPYQCMRYDSYTLPGKAFLQRNFVMEFKWTYFDRLHWLDWKVKGDGFLDPFIDNPVARSALIGYAQLTFIEHPDAFVNGITGIFFSEEIAVFPGGFYDEFEIFHDFLSY